MRLPPSWRDGHASDGRPRLEGTVRGCQAHPATQAAGLPGSCRRPLLRLSATALPAIAAACALAPRRSAVPRDQTERATVLGGLPNARFWADTQVPELVREVRRALDREREHLGPQGAGGNRLPPASLLAGWTATGDRPEFKLVTGVRTGALIAPFAFLGPAHDAELREIYTGVGQSDIFERRSYITVPFVEALSDTRPLFGLISRHVAGGMLADIALEYRKGRLLLIGTANPDVMRPVIWNVGAIAASGHPEVLGMVRRMLLASAADPAVFPPVLIDVEAAGRHYQEMHVDGGSVAQLFLYPSALTTGLDLRRGPLARERRAYVIRNARLDAGWAAVGRNVFAIAGRAIWSMIHSSGGNDVLRLQATSERDGVEFNLAYIGDDFTAEREELFDRDYMRAPFH